VREIAQRHHRDHRGQRQRRAARAEQRHQRRHQLARGDHDITGLRAREVGHRAGGIGDRGHLLAAAIQHHVQRPAPIVVGPDQQHVASPGHWRGYRRRARHDDRT
jgi:hypothetical protein